MTRLFAAHLGLLCILVMMVAGLVVAVLGSLINLELIRGNRTVSGYESGRNYRVHQLFRMHRSLFAISWKRRFLYCLFIVLLLAFIPYMVLEVNNLMNNNLLHLTSVRR
jgi:hypothetical protein